MKFLDISGKGGGIGFATPPAMKTITREFVLTALMAATLCSFGCGGGGGAAGPATPTAPSSPAAAVTVNIVGSAGNAAFSPNPATVNAGQTVAFKNNDGNPHRLVADNGSWQTGDIAPGATSSTVSVTSTTAVNFHCTIHPTMVGSLNGAAAPPAPTPNPSGGYDY